MDCARCGAELGPGVRECPDCGNRVYGNDFVYGSITVSWEEARKGGLQMVEMRDLLNPLRVRLKPRTRNGDKIRVAGAMFRQADETILLAPVEVTVHVEPRPLWQWVVTMLLCVLLLGGAGVGIWAAGEHLAGRTDQQVSTTLPSQPQPTTAPATAPTTQPTTATEPSTTAPETTESETAEVETTEPETVETESTEPETTEPPVEEIGSSIIMNYELRPMLQQMPENHLKAAEAIYQACMNFESNVTMPCEITPEDLDDIIVILHYECPELMQFDLYTNTNYYYDTATNIVTSYDLPYCLTQAEYTQMYDACVEVVDRLVDETQGMNDWEKEAYIFEYITSNCTYDFYKENAGTAYGTLVQEIAKCDGISFAVKWLMEEMGITCLVAGGDPKEGEIGHVWNYVLLDGAYYCLDVTADVQTADNACPVLYCAYNVTSELVGKDFILYPTFQNYIQPPVVTTMEKSYHVENGSFVYKGQEWKTGLKTAFIAGLESGEDVFLQFEDQAEYQAAYAEFSDLLNDYWKEAGMPANVEWIYWYHDGFYVFRIEIQKK